MPQDLGNKMNPFLAGLTGLGEGLLQGYLTRRKMDEEQRQFDAEMAQKERQYSFLGQFQQAQMKNWEVDNLRQEEVVKAQIENYKSEIKKREKTPPPKTAIKTAEIPGMGRKKGYIDLDTGEFEKDAQGNLIIAGEESGGLSVLSEYNINKDKEEKQIRIDQAQKTYNEIMDSWDEKVGAYVIRRPNGSPLLFKDEKSLRQHAIRETLKSKPPGKIDFWKRKPEDSIGRQTKIMSKDEFIKDFQKEEGRIPTDQELEQLKQEGFWK